MAKFTTLKLKILNNSIMNNHRVKNLIQKLLNQPYDEAYKYEFLTFDEVKSIDDKSVIREFCKSINDIDSNVIAQYFKNKEKYEDYITTKESIVEHINEIRTKRRHAHTDYVNNLWWSKYRKLITEFVVDYEGDNEDFEHRLDERIAELKESIFNNDEYDSDYDSDYELPETDEVEEELANLVEVKFEVDLILEDQAKKQTFEYYQQLLKSLDNIFHPDQVCLYPNITISYYHSHPNELNTTNYSELYHLIKTLKFFNESTGVVDCNVEHFKHYFNVSKLIIDTYSADEKTFELYRDYLNNLDKYHPKLEEIECSIDFNVFDRIPSSVKKFTFNGTCFQTNNRVFFDNVEILKIKSPIFNVGKAKFSYLFDVELDTDYFNLDLLNKFIKNIKITNFVLTKELRCEEFHHHTSTLSNYSLIHAKNLYVSGGCEIPTIISKETEKLIYVK